MNRRCDISWVAAECRNTTIRTVSCYRLVPLLCCSVLLFYFLAPYVRVLFVSLRFYFTFFAILALSFSPRRFYSSSLSFCCFCFLFIPLLYVLSDLPSCFFYFFLIHVYSFFLPRVPLFCSLLPFSSSYVSLFLSFPFASFSSTETNYIMEVFFHVVKFPESYEAPTFVIFSTIFSFPLPYVQFHPSAPLPNDLNEVLNPYVAWDVTILPLFCSFPSTATPSSNACAVPL